MIGYLLSFFIFALSAGVCLEAAPAPHHPFIIHATPKCGTHFIEHVISLMIDKPVFHRGLSEPALKIADETNRILRIFASYDPDAMTLLMNQHHKVIAMHRDPRDALISHLFYMRTYAGKGTKRDFFTVGADFDSLSFNDQLSALILGTNGTQSYVDFYCARAGWALHPWSLAVKFEHLIAQEGGGEEELRREAILNIAHYIEVDLSSEKLQFVLDHSYVKGEDLLQGSKVFSRASSGNWKLFLTPHHKKIFKKRIGKTLVKLGYERNHHW